MKLKELWIKEEQKSFLGWDFSVFKDRIVEEPLPWDYKSMVKEAMLNRPMLLDMGTGGGEILMSLNPVAGKTFATEMYQPNYDYAVEVLKSKGIQLLYLKDEHALPYQENTFDLIINRHESFDEKEVYRVLKPGGVFITQQVGGMNTREFATAFLGHEPTEVDSIYNLKTQRDLLEAIGFFIKVGEEYFPDMTFYDVAAFVYFASIIEWEFPGFSVEKYLYKLYDLQNEIEKKGSFKMKEHRFIICATK